MSQLEHAQQGPSHKEDNLVRVMYLLTTQSGGTPQTNEDLMSALANRHGARIECYVLRCSDRQLELLQFEGGTYQRVAEHVLSEAVAPFPHLNIEYDDVVAGWLKDFRITLIHSRHSAHQSLGLMGVARELCIPVVYSFHDYYAVCPSVKLLDEKRTFCNGRCTAGRGECHQELWQDVQVLPLKHESVYDWQLQFAGALVWCSAFVSTVSALKATMLDVYPALAEKPFPIIPHGRDFDSLVQLAVQPEANMPLRVLVPGHIAVSKGAEILMALAAMPELDHVQWHVLGTLQQGFDRLAPDNVIVHGAYQREDFQRHIAKIKPHMGAVMSIWPETWCHTLTELWAAGVPVLGFDTGAVGERLRQSGAGWLAQDLSAQAMAQAVLLASNAEVWQQAEQRVIDWQANGQRSCADMADDYWQLYCQVANADSGIVQLNGDHETL